MASLSLLFPMPGIGYMMSAREYLMNKISLDTDERDSIFSIGYKSFINTAIRCTSYSLPYFTYISSSYFIYLSQYANLGMGIGKFFYSAYSYIQGYRKNDDEKKNLANKMFKEAILHGAFSYVDSKVLDLGSYVISPVIKTYIGVGIFADFFGKSKQIHNKLFSSAEEIIIRDEDDFNGTDGDDLNLDKYNYPISPSSEGERRRRSSLRHFTRRLTRSNAKNTPPIPNTSAQTPGKRKVRAEVRQLLEEASNYQRLAANQNSKKINTES